MAKRDEKWRQDTPGDQAVAILQGIEGHCMNAQDGYISDIGWKSLFESIQNLRDLCAGHMKPEWDAE
jgi:hypothetical protein